MTTTDLPPPTDPATTGHDGLPDVLVTPPWSRRREPVVVPGLTRSAPLASDGTPGADALHAVPDLVALSREMVTETTLRLLPFTGPELADLMMELRVKSRSAWTRDLARQWLSRHPAAAARDLVPPALEEPGPRRELAGHALLALATDGHRDLVLTAADNYGSAAGAAIRAMLDTDPLELLPSTLPKIPRWVGVPTLPTIRLRDGVRTLPVESARHVVTMLSLSQPALPYAGLEIVKDVCDPVSLAAFGRALLLRWVDANCPSVGRWALDMQGLIGDDETARRLSPLIRSWPGHGDHTRAARGLDVLTAIGTDVALMHIQGVADKASKHSTRRLAKERLETLARDTGLTLEQLADRLVPDLGLDTDGSLSLDYGPRRFVVGFDERLMPFVTDAAGTRRAALPRPGVKDDPVAAPAAYQRFLGLKKDVRTVAADQIRRLERAMADQRRWSSAEFHRYLVGHPLLWHVARRLLWVTSEGPDGGEACFRVAEDRTYADLEDEPIVVTATATVWLAHPLRLGDRLAAWAEVFADYEVLQPFAQLGRDVHVLTDDERTAHSLDRQDGRTVHVGRLLGLVRRGWRMGEVGDGGMLCTLERDLPGGLVASIDLDPGMFIGDVTAEQQQTLGNVWLPTHADGKLVPGFGAIDPVAVSELIHDLQEVTSSTSST
ncbi:hypothetical protein GCM10009827_002390 [Dactylosporangium maewongense]|uniref:DUF4132 domain-containing protein n=1 Tax=Dactylosporangium maewongense TaxID=634393 RepID=A0ABN1ZIC4_9ACTN